MKAKPVMEKVWKALYIAGAAAALVLILSLVTIQVLRPRLTLGDQNVTVEAGGVFDARTLVSKISYAAWEDVTVTGEVDTSVPGEYEVTLTLDGRDKTVKVRVVDTAAPVFAPMASCEIFEGGSLTAEDLVDCARDAQEITWSIDLNGADLNTAGTYTVYVTAADPSGNETKQGVTVTVKVYDSTPPVISGVDSTGIYIGRDFDPMEGITVTDDLDPAPVVTVDTAGLDITKQGRYVLTYTAVDASGNETTVERVIQVSNKERFIYTTAGGATWNATGRAPHPYLVAVNRAMCTVTVYGKDDNGNYTVPVKAMACSVGRDGHQTLRGEYKTSERIEWCYMVDGTWGRYAIRIYRGLMFHSVPYYSIDKGDMEWEEYNKLGEPASLGCVRLCISDILWLYENCPFSFTAVIYDDTVEAGPLGKPEMADIDGSYEEARGWDPTDPDPENPWHSIIAE